ncbi:MAG: hypothetical protein HQL75_03305 [Magnetococcales bacterium]|nr:hypothetical protein [Magnetococcales bacterium]
MAIVLFAPYFMLGEDSYVRFSDGVDGPLIQLISNASNYKKHGLSYWHPNFVAGFDGLSQDEKFVGINQILFNLFDPMTAYRINVALYMILSISGAYFLLKRENGSRLLTGFLATLYYVLTSVRNDPFSNMAYAVLPWVTGGLAYLIEIEGNLRKKTISCSIAFAMGFFYAAFFMAEVADIVYISTFIIIYILLFYDGRGCLKSRIIYITFLHAGMVIPTLAIFMAVQFAIPLSYRFNPAIQESQTLLQPLVETTSLSWVYIIVLFIKRIYWYSIDIVIHTIESFASFSAVIGTNRPIIGNYFLTPFSWSLGWCLFVATIGCFFHGVREKRYSRNMLDILFLLLPFLLAGSRFLVEFLFSLGLFKIIRFWRFAQVFPLTMLLFSARYLTLSIRTPSSSRMRKGYEWLVYGSLSLLFLLTTFGTLGWITQSIGMTIRSGSQQEYLDQPELRRVHHSLTELDTMPFRAAMIREKNYFPSLLISHNFETIDGYNALIPKRFLEYWNVMTAPILNRLGPFPHGSYKLYFRLLPETMLLDEPFRMGESININLLRLANVHYVFSPVRLNDAELSHVESIQVRKPLAAFGFWSRFGDPSLRENLILHIYRLTDPFPRYFGVFAQKIFSTKEKLLEELGQSSREQLQSHVFMQEGDGNVDFGDPSENQWAEIQNILYSPDKIILRVDYSSLGILVSVFNYNPAWRVRIDGVPTGAFPAYHTFLGCMVPQGIHEVILTYEPPYKDFFYLRWIHWLSRFFFGNSTDQLPAQS